MAEKFPGYKEIAEKDPEKFNKQTRDMYERNTHRWSGADNDMPGAKSSRVQTETGIATRVEKPEGVPKVSKKPAGFTRGGGGGGGGGSDTRELQLGADLDPKAMMKRNGYKKGGMAKKYAKGGTVSSASSRGDGIAQRGKTKGKMVMCGGGMARGKK